MLTDTVLHPDKKHQYNWDWDFLLKVEALKQIIHKPLGLSLWLYEYDSELDSLGRPVGN